MGSTSTSPFDVNRSCAEQLDANDPLASMRDQFHIPQREGGTPSVYLCGNSLGLQPKAVGPQMERLLSDWAKLGVEGHFEADPDWFSYHECFREMGARLVGGLPGEVVMMNSLTVNLHLMMVSFFRPTKKRYKILIEDRAFPSDGYATSTQLIHHGLDPKAALLIARPPSGQSTIPLATIEEILENEGERIALVLLSGVQYLTGQLFDIERITQLAQAKGCTVGWDLAHTAGNVPLELHRWNVDFAAWCNYKYLNSGPGAVGGCFVHERHGHNLDLPRFAGWWGNDPETRFQMDEVADFIPRAGADGWQISNPSIFSMAPLLSSLRIFDEVGMEALRRKSELLTGYLEFLLKELGDGVVSIVSPDQPSERGCQLSLLVNDDPKMRLAALGQAGITCDFRPPNVIRAAPVPLYNTFQDVWEFAMALSHRIS